MHFPGSKQASLILHQWFSVDLLFFSFNGACESNWGGDSISEFRGAALLCGAFPPHQARQERQ